MFYWNRRVILLLACTGLGGCAFFRPPTAEEAVAWEEERASFYSGHSALQKFFSAPDSVWFPPVGWNDHFQFDKHQDCPLPKNWNLAPPSIPTGPPPGGLNRSFPGFQPFRP